MVEERSAFESFELGLPPSILGFLKETSKWSFFLAVVGFVGIGLMALVGIIITVSMGLSSFNSTYQEFGMNMTYFGLIYIVLAVIYFFPVLYLFNFSRKLKTALASNDMSSLTEAFSNLKSHYKFIGILAIVVVSIYILAFVFAIMAGMM